MFCFILLHSTSIYFNLFIISICILVPKKLLITFSISLQIRNVSETQPRLCVKNQLWLFPSYRPHIQRDCHLSKLLCYLFTIIIKQSYTTNNQGFEENIANWHNHSIFSCLWKNLRNNNLLNNQSFNDIYLLSLIV